MIELSNDILKDLTEQDINDLVGTRVMGWILSANGAYYEAKGLVGYSVLSFKPMKNMDHAWMVLDHVHKKYRYKDEWYRVVGHLLSASILNENNKGVCELICTAALRTVGISVRHIYRDIAQGGVGYVGSLIKRERETVDTQQAT